MTPNINSETEFEGKSGNQIHFMREDECNLTLGKEEFIFILESNHMHTFRMLDIEKVLRK